MAPRLYKCTNYSGCKLAYRNEKITVATKDLRCPECGSPLEPVGPKKQTPFVPYVIAGTGVVLLLALAAILWTLSQRPPPRVLVEVTPPPTVEPSSPPPPPPTVEPSSPPPPPPTVESSSPSPPPTVEPSSPPADPNNVRATVLKRITQMPNMQESAKDRLRDAVMQAKDLGLLFTVLFDTARSNLSPVDLAYIKDQLGQTKNKENLKDPTLVLVILGFADTRGPDVKSYDLSSERAQSVMAALRDQCGVRNEMHAVPMGGTAIFDPRDYAKNRVVEVWSGRP